MAEAGGVQQGGAGAGPEGTEGPQLKQRKIHLVRHIGPREAQWDTRVVIIGRYVGCEAQAARLLRYVAARAPT